jgi:hypothetical protein
MSKDSRQQVEGPKKFQLGPLGNLNQVVKALGKTIRAMADGTIDSQVGARICMGHLPLFRQVRHATTTIFTLSTGKACRAERKQNARFASIWPVTKNDAVGFALLIGNSAAG